MTTLYQNELTLTQAKWLYLSDSVVELLGFEPHELLQKPSLDLVHPDEFPRVKQLHYDTIQQDKAAVLVYLRMRHKDPYKGYILCGVSRTVVHNVLVGSVSFASPGAKALHNASTAQEITVITESAESNFQFKRWSDPSPMPKSPIPSSMALPASPSPSTSSWGSGSPRNSQSPRRISSSANQSPSVSPERRPSREDLISFDHLSNKSFRTAFILDRFSMNCTILYCSNDLLVSQTSAVSRSFFDFVAKKEEEIVRSWITCVKGWGVNEKGQPSDGGFGFGRFTLLTEGRDSVSRMPEPPTPSRHRKGSTSRGNGNGNSRSQRSGTHVSRSTPTGGRLRGPTYSPTSDASEQFLVDAIFSAHSDGLMVILRRAS
ncbi:hypothetical protein B0H34DRAFT_437579 [Crassisporium funariophilum]|nr:hypothetical protein B0H34DRAFT_437579 [Crassisporium funariophilum]